MFLKVYAVIMDSFEFELSEIRNHDYALVSFI